MQYLWDLPKISHFFFNYNILIFHQSVDCNFVLAKCFDSPLTLSYFHYHTYSKSHHTNYYPYIIYYWNYYQFSERNCIVGEPRRLCIYDRVKGKILKTVDSVYQAIDSREDCEDLCNSAPFRCHSYDYNDTGDFVCRLSHHSAHTLTQIEEPYLAIGKRKFIVKKSFKLPENYFTIDFGYTH